MIVEERDCMKKSSITLGYDEERLSAARLYLKRKGLTLEEEMVYRGERRSGQAR